MSNMVERLREHLASMTEEEKQAEWEELKKWNDVGPTMDEYIQGLKDMAEARIEYGEKELHRLELTGEWTKDKKAYRELKKAVEYWKHYLEELNRN